MSQSPVVEIVARDKSMQPPLYAKRDIALVRGEGAYLWDSNGNRYLDMMSNYGVNILGHSHPAITEAVSQQASTLLNCHQSFANDVRVRFLDKLASIAKSLLQEAGVAPGTAIRFGTPSGVMGEERPQNMLGRVVTITSGKGCYQQYRFSW